MKNMNKILIKLMNLNKNTSRIRHHLRMKNNINIKAIHKIVRSSNYHKYSINDNIAVDHKIK